MAKFIEAPKGPPVNKDEYYESKELRKLVDDVLDSKIRYETVLAKYGRNEGGVETILGKIVRNYTEGGRRKSPYVRIMQGGPSRLDRGRRLSEKDKQFLKRLLDRDHMKESQYTFSHIADIMNIDVAKVVGSVFVNGRTEEEIREGKRLQKKTNNRQEETGEDDSNLAPKSSSVKVKALEGITSAQNHIRELIRFIGDDPNREGLKETPDRVVRAYLELFSGYRIVPKDVLKTFKDGTCDEMVVVRGVSFTSFCEHHLLPFFGVAHVAYIPNGRIVGLSKLARLVDIYARRLQVQERMTVQITQALDEVIKPLGSACVIEAQHSCMMCRGVRKSEAFMVTSSLTGEFRNSGVRQEFLSFIGR